MSDLLDAVALSFSLAAFGFSLLGWKRAELGLRLYQGIVRLVESLTRYVDEATARLPDVPRPAESADEGEITSMTGASAGLYAAPMTRRPRKD